MTVRQWHEEWRKFYEQYREILLRGGGVIGVDPASYPSNTKG